MWRTLMWLNLYGWETAFFVFLGCFCNYVGQPHNHMGWGTLTPFTSINPPIHEIFTKFFENWRFWKTQFFWVGHFFLLHPHESWSKFLGYQGWVEILMITLVSGQKSLRPNISACSVELRKKAKLIFFPRTNLSRNSKFQYVPSLMNIVCRKDQRPNLII